MSVQRFTDVSWLRASAALGASLLGWVGCSFESQPLFEPARAGANTGGAQLAPDAQVPAKVGENDVSNTDVSDSGPRPGDASSACRPLQGASCSSGSLLRCKADGSGFESVACGPAGCNLAADGCNECAPGQLQCSGDALVACDADGRVQQRESCALGCVSGAGQAACRACQSGQSSCRGDAAARCAPDGMSWQTRSCPDGCDAGTGACKGALLRPSNLAREACALSDLEDLDYETSGVLDTDQACRRVISQGAGQPELCLIAQRDVRVREGVVLRVQGSRALALLATRKLQIDGRISVSARGTDPGPGSAASKLGAGAAGVGKLADGTTWPAPPGMVIDWAELPASGGGGGGGYATSGAPGGSAPESCGPRQSCASGGAGGAAHGDERLSPLHGGASGGLNSASDESSRRSQPGAGGGALQLVACEQLLLGAHAVLDANGGGGEGGAPGTLENMLNDTPGGGAGGGSGGAILIQARKLAASAGALLVANGGGGGGGASRTVKGSEPLQWGDDGQDGRLSSEPAAGGAPAGMSQPGGAGGALVPPGAGGTAKMHTSAAGGGGGAGGRIRIEIGGPDAILQGVVSSPPASRGSALLE